MCARTNQASQMQGQSLRFDRRHLLGASGHPLGTALRACRRMPSAVCTFAHTYGVNYAQDRLSLVRPNDRAYLRLVRVSSARTRAGTACLRLSDRYKCRNAVYNQISKSLGTNLRFVPSPCQYGQSE